MTREMKARRLEDQRTFYCPAGHPQSYHGKTEKEKLKDEIAYQKREVERLDRERKREIANRTMVEHRLRAQKGVVTKLKKRVGKGACPCCNRHFANLERHMTTQHPDFVEGS
jgi:hypothetical protein